MSNDTLKPLLGKARTQVAQQTKPLNSFSAAQSPTVKPKPVHGVKRTKTAITGKKTERDTIYLIQQYYGKQCRIDRLPDSFDAGHYEDIRPCDLFITLARGQESESSNIWYVECKETNKEKINLPFSVLNTGQRKAIKNTLDLKINYFVVFQHLRTGKIYLIPASKIVETEKQGKKSLNEFELEPYTWINKGKLYDYYSK